MRYLFLILFAVLSLVILVAAAWVLLKRPSGERTWLPEYERTATAEASSDGVTIKNVRDWTYGDTVLSEDWKEVTVDPSTITRAWFIIEPFGSFEGVGHTFLSFEFENTPPLSFSVQARQEQGEKYSSFVGLFNTYELAYQWGTERDFIGRRLVYLKHDIRMYPLAIPTEDAKRLFASLIEETNELATSPRFYNTLTANCTNMLANIVNKHYPNRLPYNISWNLTGYSDGYLMKEGLIEMPGSEEETKTAFDLTPYRSVITGVATSSEEVFSATVRSFLVP